MKRFYFWLELILVFCVVLFFGCNTNKDKKENEKALDDTATLTTVELPPTSKKNDVLIIQHKVANFANWKKLYDAHDSIRLLHGLRNYAIGRGINDSNTIIIFLKMEDTLRAKTLVQSSDLKDRMQKAGFLGVPSFMYVEVIFNDSSFIDQTARMMVTHKVKEFTAWKKIYDDQKSERMKAGLIDRGLGYSLGDKNLVAIVLAVTDFKKASAYGNSPDLKDKMIAAGVDGPPTFFYYNVVQKY
jgi:hypothetical protein